VACFVFVCVPPLPLWFEFGFSFVRHLAVGRTFAPFCPLASPFFWRDAQSPFWRQKPIRLVPPPCSSTVPSVSADRAGVPLSAGPRARRRGGRRRPRGRGSRPATAAPPPGAALGVKVKPLGIGEHWGGRRASASREKIGGVRRFRSDVHLWVGGGARRRRGVQTLGGDGLADGGEAAVLDLAP